MRLGVWQHLFSKQLLCLHSIYNDDRESFKDRESPYKIFDNTTIIWLAVLWMFIGLIVHYFRIMEVRLRAARLLFM